jgi:hypothetical protein
MVILTHLICCPVLDSHSTALAWYCPGMTSESVDLPPKKISSFLQPVKDVVGVKANGQVYVDPATILQSPLAVSATAYFFSLLGFFFYLLLVSSPPYLFPRLTTSLHPCLHSACNWPLTGPNRSICCCCLPPPLSLTHTHTHTHTNARAHRERETEVTLPLAFSVPFSHGLTYIRPDFPHVFSSAYRQLLLFSS